MGDLVAIETNVQDVIAGVEIGEKELARALAYAAKDIGREIRYDYQRTTRTWTDRPEFEVLTEVRGDEITVVVGTDDPVYGYVDLGTDEHFIFPKKPGGKLVFVWGGPGSYKAKTTPGVIGSVQGGPTGVKTARAWVLHPGTEARKFTETIQEKFDRRAPEIADEYIERWASGRRNPA